jgi:hypothetical protein
MNNAGAGGAANMPVNAVQSMAWLAGNVNTGCYAGLVLTLLWLLCRVAARRNWLASVLMIMIWVAFLIAPGASVVSAGLAVLLTALLTLGITRFGVLAVAAATYTQWCLNGSGGSPLTTNWSVWYAHNAMLGIAAVLAVAIYGFRTTIAGRPLFSAASETAGI